MISLGMVDRYPEDKDATLRMLQSTIADPVFEKEGKCTEKHHREPIRDGECNLIN